MDRPVTASDVEKPPPRVQSVARAISILSAVADAQGGLRAAEIAAACKLGRQGTYHLLHTLVSLGALIRNQEGRYIIGMRLASIGQAFLRQSAPPEFLGPLVRRVAEATGETAYGAGWAGGEIVNLVSASGTNAVQAIAVPPGYHEHAHARAVGKLLLAFAEPEMVEQYLAEHALTKRTPNTINSKKALKNELEIIRQNGHAIDREEFAVGLTCLAVPVGHNKISFAIGLTVPTPRFKENFQKYLRIMLAQAGG